MNHFSPFYTRIMVMLTLALSLLILIPKFHGTHDPNPFESWNPGGGTSGAKHSRNDGWDAGNIILHNELIRTVSKYLF